MAKKTKKAKGKKDRKKEQEEGAPKQEMDAVKGFIGVMVVLTLALGVFQIIKAGELDEVESDLKLARAQGPRLRDMSREINAYLDLIKNSQETTLLSDYLTFFKNIYTTRDVNAAEADVKIGRKEDQRNSLEGYTEYYWDIDIRNLERKGVAAFMWEVQRRSPKAKTIEALIRREEREGGEEIWNGRFRVGYRVATAR